MNKDLGLSPYVFGWGAGIFFLGYFLFEDKRSRPPESLLPIRCPSNDINRLRRYESGDGKRSRPVY